MVNTQAPAQSSRGELTTGARIAEGREEGLPPRGKASELLWPPHRPHASAQPRTSSHAQDDDELNATPPPINRFREIILPNAPLMPLAPVGSHRTAGNSPAAHRPYHTSSEQLPNLESTPPHEAAAAAAGGLDLAASVPLFMQSGRKPTEAA